jgi:tripartite-type tricarboxylate transporter receptor subunit TctC
MKYRRFSLIAGLLLAACASTGVFAEENFPSRSIRVVIPYAPGTVANVFGRIVGQNLAVQWNNALATDDVRQKLDTAGCEVESTPLGKFTDKINADVALWARVVKEAGITAD